MFSTVNILGEILFKWSLKQNFEKNIDCWEHGHYRAYMPRAPIFTFLSQFSITDQHSIQNWAILFWIRVYCIWSVYSKPLAIYGPFSVFEANDTTVTLKHASVQIGQVARCSKHALKWLELFSTKASKVNFQLSGNNEAKHLQSSLNASPSVVCSKKTTEPSMRESYVVKFCAWSWSISSLSSRTVSSFPRNFITNSLIACNVKRPTSRVNFTFHSAAEKESDRFVKKMLYYNAAGWHSLRCRMAGMWWLDLGRAGQGRESRASCNTR